MEQILQDLAKLEEKFQGSRDFSEIKQLSGDVHKTMLLASLSGHQGIKMLLDPMEEKIKKINDSLLENDSAKINDYNRDRMLDERNMYRTFIDGIKNAPVKLQKLHERILYELEP